jgi:mono/diheme cytochrome c family protein
MLISMVLPVDVAVSALRGTAVVIAAGNAHNPGLPQVAEFSLAMGAPCESGFSAQPDGEAIAVAYDSTGTIVVQTREPALVQWLDTDRTAVSLSPVSVEDTGHAIFHANSGGSIACASCHAEGGEDGRVWSFDRIGKRRTQSLRVGVIGTEPFHWDGDEVDLPTLVGDVFVGRMSGPALADDQLGALRGFLGGITPWPIAAASDPAAVARGALLFQGDGGCTGCHAGPKLTLNQTLDVGTGARLQIPSLLGVGYRAPFLHDGRAPTLTDRFDPQLGGGDLHGHTSQLSPGDVADLVAYLSTL